MENEELDNIIILNDENGNEVKFEFLDLVELDEEEYVVLLPVSEEGEEDEGEVVILKLEDTDEESEEESYVGVEDEEILKKVFAIFKEKYSRYYICSIYFRNIFKQNKKLVAKNKKIVYYIKN